MSERTFYVVCKDDCMTEGMSKEQILSAIEQALEQGYVSDPSSAVFSKIKEIRANGTAQIWIGTEAQFNAISPAPTISKSVVRMGTNGVLYLCTDDSTVQDVTPIEGGGTGATNADKACANLGAAQYVELTQTAYDALTDAEKNNGKIYCITDSSETPKSYAASEITYSNKNSGLTATTVQSAIDEIVDFIYPVGAIYMSVNSTSPATLFGGTWERIKDTFLLSAGDTYAAGATGGEASHALTAAELPDHTHHAYSYTTGESDWAFLNVKRDGHEKTQVSTSTSSGRYVVTGNSASNVDNPYYTKADEAELEGVAHNNMPPYLAVYVWKRTA